MMVIEDNKALVRDYFEEVFNRRNLEAIDRFVAADQVDHTLPANLPANTTGTKRAVSMFLQAVPDLRVTIDDIVAEGDRVDVRYTSRGTLGRASGMPAPLRKQIAVSSYLTARVANGKIVEMWGLDDQMGMLRQLGIVPAVFGFVFAVGLGAGLGIGYLAGKSLR